MSGTKVKTLLKNLKTQDESTLEAFQELPITFRDVSSTTPAPLDVYVSENKAFIKMPVAGDSAASSTWTASPSDIDSTVRLILDEDATAPGAAIKAATAVNAAYVAVGSLPANGSATTSIGVTGSSGVASILTAGSDIHITASTSSTGTQTKVFLDGSENKVSVTGSLDVSSGLEITGSLKSTNTSTPISIGESSQNTISLDSINMNIGSNTTEVINLSSDEVRVTAPLVPTTNELEVKSLTDVGSAVGVTISKPAQGSSYLQLAEYLSGNPYGARLVYEGDAAGEDLQTTDNTVALQGVTPDSEAGINNILSFHREGTAVRLESQDTLVVTSPQLVQIASQNETDILSTGTNSSGESANIEVIGGDGTNSGAAVVKFNVDDHSAAYPGRVWVESGRFQVGSASNLSDVFFHLPDDTESFDTTYIGQTASGKLYKRTGASASFFSGTHVYPSNEVLPTGCAVQLVDGSVVISSVANSTTCVGVVATSRELKSDTAHSLGNINSENPPTHLTMVVALGDTRLMDCQGFNVCNESGAIVPGDLLVTSSTPGYLMKQADDIIRSSTVGKAMEQVTFDENGQATGVYGYLYCG